MKTNQQDRKQATHGALNNLRFMVREQWIFEKKPVFAWIFRVLSELAVSLLGIYFPKVVLDSICQSISGSEFILRIGVLTMTLITCKYASFFTEQSVIIGAVRILNMRFYLGKDWKVL